MKTGTKATGGKGLLVHPDDLQVGRFDAVHSIKNGPTETHPVLGRSFKLKAINLPFLVGELVPDPAHPALTFGGRYLDFMRVIPDDVRAQTPPDGAGPD
jgi:hypothetical protein